MKLRRSVVGLGIAVAALGAAAAVAPAALRAGVQWTAARRGLEVTVDEVRLGLTHIVLVGVSVNDGARGVLRGSFTEVYVHRDGLRLDAVDIRGGALELAGTPAELRAAFDAQRGEREVSHSTESPRGRRIRGDELNVDWRGRDGERLTASGVRFQVAPVMLDAKIRSLRVEAQGVSAEAVGVDLAFDRRDGSIESLSAERTDALLELERGASSLSGSNPSLPAVSSATASVPAVSSATAAAENPPAFFSQVFGFDPSRGARVRAVVARFVRAINARVHVGRSVNLDNISLRATRGKQTLNVGPGSLRLERLAERIVVRVSPGSLTRSAAPLSFELEIPSGSGQARASITGGPIQLSELGVREGDFGFVGVSSSELRIDSSATLLDAADTVEFASRGSARGIGILQQRLAPVPLLGMGFAWDVSGSFLLSGGALSIQGGEVSLGAVASRVDAKLTRDASHLAVEAHLSVPKASCQAMFESLPEGALPLLAGARLRGDFAWQAGVTFDTDHLLETSASWRMANGCRFQTIPEMADPERFRDRFTREVPGPDKEPLEVVSGPGSEDWVPLGQTARYLESAVLTTEDGGFWRHHGFDQHAIEGAIRQNLAAGEFQRGASTISMQLAKNLYLSRDKYVARKVQEALLTMLIEQEMRKDELLELYFNVIEYGPGVYGVGPAARYYFNSTAGELSIAQSFFLASLLPSPNAQHFEPSGALKPKWRAYLRELMRIAARRGRLTEQELKEGLAEEIRFGVPNLLSNPYRIERGVVPEGEPGEWVAVPDADD